VPFMKSSTRFSRSTSSTFSLSSGFAAINPP
jgi:hypothetical protein